MPETIKDTIEIGTPTLAPDGRLKQSDTKSYTLKANPALEYVSANGRQWAQNYLQSLPFYVDDVTADFGDDLYDRMMLDSQVSACVETFKMAVLADGVQVLPAVDQFNRAGGKRTENPEYAQAKEIADFIARNLTEQTGMYEANHCPGIGAALYDMLDFAAFGNRVAEKVFEIASAGPDAGKMILRAIKVKPRRSCAFVTDVFFNVVGLLSLIPGQFAPTLLQSVINDPQNVPNLLPRSKFAVLTFRNRSGDPRGRSMLRPAYDAWFVKQQLKQERLAFFARLAGGSVVGFTPEDAQDVPQLDANGVQMLDPVTHAPLYINPEQYMLASLIGWQNGTAAVFPGGAKVEVHYPDAHSPFDIALDRQDREICTAVLGSTRMMMEAEHGSKADSGTAQDVFGLLVSHGKNAVAEMLTKDIVHYLVYANYGPDAMHLVPKIALSKTEQQDFAAVATAIAALFEKQYLAPSQLPDTDAMLGLPVREDGEAVMPADIAAEAAKNMPTGDATKPGQPTQKDKPTDA